MADDDFLKDAYRDRPDAETQAFYDGWAATYDDSVLGNDYAQPRRCTEALLTLIGTEGNRVLDVGCGTGLSGMALHAAGFRGIDGCDFSDEMLTRAGARGVYDRLFQTNLNTPPMDAGDAAYDAATCVGVFSFGHVAPDAVEEILRVIKPGAPLIIGLNELFYRDGRLTTKLRALAEDGKLEILAEEEGAHLPGEDLAGWVLTLRKT